MSDWTPLEQALRRDRTIVIGSLLTVAVLAWVYILRGAGMGVSAWAMTQPIPGMGVMARAEWTPGYAVLMFFMWWIMMIAMMLPSAAPMILMYAAIRRRNSGAPYAPSGIFTLGYLIAWAAFSTIAVLVQWSLERSGLLSAMMLSTSTFLSATILVLAGVWQLTPIKQACLRHCRSPVHYISEHWRDGRSGAFRMGVGHGLYCLGCCWFLMALLFYGGVMNLYWIVGLALYVLLEKLVPNGQWLGRVIGMSLIVWGGLLLISVR